MVGLQAFVRGTKTHRFGSRRAFVPTAAIVVSTFRERASWPESPAQIVNGSSVAPSRQ